MKFVLENTSGLSSKVKIWDHWLCKWLCGYIKRVGELRMVKLFLPDHLASAHGLKSFVHFAAEYGRVEVLKFLFSFPSLRLRQDEKDFKMLVCYEKEMRRKRAYDPLQYPTADIMGNFRLFHCSVKRYRYHLNQIPKEHYRMLNKALTCEGYAIGHKKMKQELWNWFERNFGRDYEELEDNDIVEKLSDLKINISSQENRNLALL